MMKAKTRRIGRRVLEAVTDRARAGILPRSLQGGLRSYSSIPIDFDHSRRALGVVVGLRKEEHLLVCGAYPEWDFLFVSQRADPDRIASECQRLEATVIVGPDIRRRFLMAFNTAAINSLSLSPAPLPRLRSGKGVARGFTLEPQSSWVTGRRMSDLDVMFDLREMILTRQLRQDAAKLALALDAKPSRRWLLAIDPPKGLWAFSDADRSAILQSSGADEVAWLPIPVRYWEDEAMDIFDEYLSQSSAIVSMGHPLAVAASLRGFRPVLSKAAFRAHYTLKADPPVALDAASNGASSVDADTIDRIAISVLIAARYVHEGALVDPLEFMSGTTP